MIETLTDGASLDWLQEQAAKRTCIVEIGVWKGAATARMAEVTSGVVYAIDHFLGNKANQDNKHQILTSPEGRQQVIAECARNLDPYIRGGSVVLLPIASRDAAYLLGEHFRPDMVWIDGDHDEDSVRDDINTWSPKLQPGGLLCGHDISFEGVRKAVDSLVPVWKLGGGDTWFSVPPSVGIGP